MQHTLKKGELCMFEKIKSYFRPHLLFDSTTSLSLAETWLVARGEFGGLGNAMRLVQENNRYRLAVKVARSFMPVAWVLTVLFLLSPLLPILTDKIVIPVVLFVLAIAFCVFGAFLSWISSRMQKKNLQGELFFKDLCELQSVFGVDGREMTVDEIQGIVALRLTQLYNDFKRAEVQGVGSVQRLTFLNTRRVAARFFDPNTLIGKDVEVPLQLAS